MAKLSPPPQDTELHAPQDRVQRHLRRHRFPSAARHTSGNGRAVAASRARCFAALETGRPTGREAPRAQDKFSRGIEDRVGRTPGAHEPVPAGLGSRRPCYARRVRYKAVPMARRNTIRPLVFHRCSRRQRRVDHSRSATLRAATRTRRHALPRGTGFSRGVVRSGKKNPLL